VWNGGCERQPSHWCLLLGGGGSGAEQSGRWWVRFKDSWPLLGERKAIARLFSREGRRRGEETM
jgi:hypothetical protein